MRAGVKHKSMKTKEVTSKLIFCVILVSISFEYQGLLHAEAYLHFQEKGGGGLSPLIWL